MRKRRHRHRHNGSRDAGQGAAVDPSGQPSPFRQAEFRPEVTEPIAALVDRGATRVRLWGWRVAAPCSARAAATRACAGICRGTWQARFARRSAPRLPDMTRRWRPRRPNSARESGRSRRGRDPQSRQTPDGRELDDGRRLGRSRCGGQGRLMALSSRTATDWEVRQRAGDDPFAKPSANCRSLRFAAVLGAGFERRPPPIRPVALPGKRQNRAYARRRSAA